MIYSGRQPGSVTMPKYPYERVAEDLLKKIKDGEYQPGDQLPSRTKLCEMYDVSGIVADRAMWILRREGVTETLPGVGVYVRKPEA